VVTTFGVMFTADQDKAAAELVRVCKPGGKIGLANWTPDGFIGQLFKTIGKHMPPPAGVKSPALWGSGARITEFFGAQASSIQLEQRDFVFRYRSAQHWLDVFTRDTSPLSTTRTHATTVSLIAMAARTTAAVKLRDPFLFLVWAALGVAPLPTAALKNAECCAGACLLWVLAVQKRFGRIGRL
jgi:hypothetical protein